MQRSSRVQNSWTSSGRDFIVAIDQGHGLRSGLENAIRGAIRDGRLHPGETLPSSRALAADLGAARGTVVEAYAQLAAEGWLVARQGQTTRVADLPRPVPPAAVVTPVRRFRHDLRPGHADLSSFPRRQWAAAVRRVLSEAPDEAFGYSDPRGRIELRTALAGYLGRARGVRTGPAQLVICTGAGHGMGLVLRTLARQGARRVAIEDPSSARLRMIAADCGLQLAALPCDARGARVGALAELGVDAVVVTPAHQYPSGVTLAPDRRNELVRWAHATGGLVIEDDYDGELRYDRQPVGALQALDPKRVIYAGTASKSLAPALRVGWLGLPAHLVDPVVDTLQLINAAPSSVEQLSFARLIDSGLFDRHIRHLRGVYRRRRDLLIAALAAHAGVIRVTGVAAGGHALVRLPADGPDEATVISTAARRHIALDGLSSHRFTAASGPSWPLPPALIIGYGTPPGHSYRAAVAALGDHLSDLYRPQHAGS